MASGTLNPLSLTSRTAVVASVGGVSAAILGGTLGALGVHSSGVALSLAALTFCAVVAMLEPRAILLLVLPASLITARVGGDFVSTADVVLFLATLVAVVLIRPKTSTTIRALLWAGVIYLALSVPTLLLNPYAANVVEWFHEVVLVLGSMIVGYALGYGGWGGRALWIYVVIAAVIAIWVAIVAGIQIAETGKNLGVYLPGLHKNFTGAALASATVIALARPAWMGGSRTWATILGAVCFAGVVASGSRQGLAGAVAGISIIVLMLPRNFGWLKLAIPIGVIATALLLTDSVNEQLTSDDQHNSAVVRLDVYQGSLDIWRTSPWFGVGMRWWYTDRFPGLFQPPNVGLEVLTTTGIVGLLGFVLMAAIVLFALAQMGRDYSTVAIAVVVARLVQAQFDQFWAAGQSSVLWVVAGIAVGAMARAQQSKELRAAAWPTSSSRDLQHGRVP